MRRLVVSCFVVVVVVLMAAGVAGARSESAPYAQVVDSETKNRFEADESWGESSYGRSVYGDYYRFARPDEDGTVARFKVEIPESAKYAVYARWPEVEGLSDSAPVGVETASGLEWKELDQRQDGGRWVRIGAFQMEEGDDYYVRFSPETDGEGYVAADAVKVVQISAGDPDDSEGDDRSNSSSESDEKKTSESDASSKKTSKRDALKKLSEKTDSEETDSSAESKKKTEVSATPEEQDVIREARKWIGTRYRLGGASRRGIDCSGLTMLVYREFDVKLPHWDDKQYRYGSKVSGALRPGDLVFFNEHGDGISHEGIYSGNGKIIHASDYYNKVVESDMKYIKGYVGARRML